MAKTKNQILINKTKDFKIKEKKPIELNFSEEWERYIPEFNKLVDILGWAGFKKDSNKGAIYGYFLLNKYHEENGNAATFYINSTECFIFSGKVGGEVSIIETTQSNAYQEVDNRLKSYVQLTPKKMATINNWPNLIYEIKSMIIYKKLKEG